MPVEIDPVLLETVGTLLAAALTVMVLSYIIGDNAFFRLATYLFVGVASGFAASIAWHEVLKPRLITPLVALDPAQLGSQSLLTGVLIPLALIVLLGLRLVPGARRLGGLPVAILVGVGAAAVVGGAITGTIVPQTLAAMQSPLAAAPLTGETGFERLANVTIVLVGTVGTLAYFGFSVRRGEGDKPRLGWRRFRTPIGGVALPWPLFPFLGEVFIAIAFGVMFAGALSASLLYLTERLQFLAAAFQTLLGNLISLA